MDTKTKNVNNSTPQDRTGTEDLTPDPLPPDVKIVEASCALADNRTPDNSKWLNIIKEPFEVQKGSEIRIVSNFIDMRGIDQEIIQFQSTGPNQDNAHTLLTQLYTCNDGYNGKTTSYDYMSRGNAFQVIDPGEMYGTPGATFIADEATGGSGTGCACLGFMIQAHCIRPKNINITSPGSGYINGAKFTIPSGGDDYEGRLLTDDSGLVKKLIFTKFHSANVAPNINDIVIQSNSSFGTGLTVSITATQNGVKYNTISGARTDAERGTGYKYGDLLTVVKGPAGTDIPAGNQAQVMLESIYLGEGQINNQEHFDQGYNYERCPVERWAQTYEINESFVYGGNTGTRTFISHGQEVSIPDENSHQINDPCLSAGGLIMNKEDEFASGIYHEGSPTDSFFINKPVLHFPKSTTQTMGMVSSQTNNSWYLFMPEDTFSVEVDGKTVQGSMMNVYPPGSVLQFVFNTPNKPFNTLTQQELVDMNGFTQQWANTMRVKAVHPKGIINDKPTLELSSTLKDFVGTADEFNLYDYPSPVNTYPANSAVNIPIVYQGSDDGGGPPEELFVPVFYTDADGQLTSYNVGNEGKGVRVGQYFSVDTGVYPNATEKFLVVQTDQTGGWQIVGPQDQILDDTNLTFTSGGTPIDLELFVVPVQNHSAFVEDDINLRGDRIGFLGSSTPPEYTGFPSTQENSIITTTSATSASEYRIPEVVNGMYRKSGNLDTDNPFFQNKLGALVNHDTEIKLNCTSDNSLLKTVINIPYGQAGTDVVIPFGDPNDIDSDWLEAGGGEAHLKINTANWAALPGTPPLPINTLLGIISEDGADVETQLQLGGVVDFDATFTYIQIISKDIFNTDRTLYIVSPSTQTYLSLPSNKLEATTAGSYNNLNGNIISNVQFQYVAGQDIHKHNTQLEFQWNSTSGSIGITGMQNFFNKNDINYELMKNTELYKNTQSVLNSYNKGGYYFMTHFSKLLTTAIDDGFYDLTSSTKNLFNMGYDFWNFGKLKNEMYSWRDNYVAPNEFNNNQSFTNISKIWNYYPLYRQKSFSIDKNFCVASDISGIWTRAAHKLTGAVNPIDGSSYVDASESGILQNEFMMPVYGSNNEINSQGEYIKNNELYGDTAGLEPGHCVGKMYPTSSALWLSGDLLTLLPQDKSGNSFYYVFFRTPWTFIRGYDPLKTTGAGQPDKEPLETVNTTADKIGNANAHGSTTKKALNGQTMIAENAASPHPSAFELGEAAGVPHGGSPVRFGEQSFYPIHYLDRTLRGEYPKAKISQFIGSTNLTLAFATDISTFTFQFFHQPYTSPFVDGIGGTPSIRVFFGNRKAGIFNHEALGGITVINYCRPDFPRNTFTLTEIKNNPSFNPQFIYGIDPLKSVGYVGRNFLNKLGFTDNNIGIINGKITPDNTELGFRLTPYTRTTTLLTDGDVGTNTYSINSFNTKFYGTTGSDVDSSDALLAEIPSPEGLAGLESFNQLEIPQVGKSNPILRKFGDFIFYPYSINTDTNSFADKAITRFDNASSTYGAVGGLLLSNSNRGMGLPNTVGSTFICDDSSIPRTLNPDCELYLAYTIATNSSLKQASLLPVRLTNAYLIVLSSLMKETNLYMPKAGFVNAMSVVSKTFLQGDFILSQGQLTFYAKDTFMLSRIETEIKDTQFTAPSTLGINSTVIYQITNYNPQPKRQLPTIEQMQDQDYEIMRMMNSHLNYLQGRVNTSPINQLNQDLYNLGLNIMSTNKNSVDVISAIRNQINTHDLVNLNPNERTQFLRSQEGQILLQNTGDLAVINQEIGRVAEARNDVDGVYGGPGAERRLEMVSREAQREIGAREREIRERTPLLYFQQSAPVEGQIPPLPAGIGDIEIKETDPQSFRVSVPYRYRMYLDYKDESIRGLHNPRSFLEYQQFQFGNVLQPDKPVRDIDPAFMADLRQMDADGERLYQRAVDEMNPEKLLEKQRNPFFNAYLEKPIYSRGDPSNPQFFDEVDSFRQEVETGRADLSHIQREILGDLARPTHSGIGINRKLNVDRYRQNFSKKRDLLDKVFRTPEAKQAAEEQLDAYDRDINAIRTNVKNATKKKERKRLVEAKTQFLGTLETGAHIAPLKGKIDPLSGEDLLRTRDVITNTLYEGLLSTEKRERDRRDANLQRAEGADEGLGIGGGSRAGRTPAVVGEQRRGIYDALTKYQDNAMTASAEDERDIRGAIRTLLD